MTMLIHILMLSTLAYLAWGVLYQLAYALLGGLYRVPSWPPAQHKGRIAVFIPAYREDAVIVQTARAALGQHYPPDKYEVIVIADSLRADTLAALRKLPIRVVEVHFPKSTKAKALNRALEVLADTSFDIAVILDADNEMQPDFLARINAAFARGVRVLQGRRAAKNADTPMAILDGLSEDANNHILCKGHSVLGLSARLAGSGMAFDYALFQEIMPQVDAIGGFDKELELRLTRRGERIFYDHGAEILDEKVRQGAHFSRQRSRWIAAQFHYARRFVPLAFVRLCTKGQLDHFNKAVQMLLPPRLLTPGILALGALLLTVLGYYPLAMAWAIVCGLNISTFLLALPAYTWQSPYRDALLRVPLAFIHALRSLLGITKANKEFIHTPHGK
ncbi:MAG: glycosyltransferase [Bacteroidetes bacterium]|nr:MAG: glycosyltransferase [Bacteroidota bacterium]